jgi:hypothetical protein
MSSKGSSTSKTLLIVLLVLITFPFWIGALGIVFGVIGGVFGAIFGVFGSVFGALASLIALPFKFIFGWHDWNWGPHFHFNGFLVFSLIILLALIIRRKQVNENSGPPKS